MQGQATVDPAVLTGIFAVTGTIIAGVISIVGIYVTQRTQSIRERETRKEQMQRDMEKEHLVDKRTIRDSRLIRVRSYYQTVLFTAHNAIVLLQQEEVLRSGEFSGEVVKVFEEQWRQYVKDCNVALSALTLETTDPQLRQMYQRLKRIFAFHMGRLLSRDSSQDTSVEAWGISELEHWIMYQFPHSDLQFPDSDLIEDNRNLIINKIKNIMDPAYSDPEFLARAIHILENLPDNTYKYMDALTIQGELRRGLKLFRNDQLKNAVEELERAAPEHLAILEEPIP